MNKVSIMSFQLFKAVFRNLFEFHHFSTISHESRLTKKSCIACLKNCKSMAELKQIQSQVFRIGLHENNDALNKLIVFSTDPSLGDLRYAERIFEYIEEPNLFVYNVMIKAYTKSNSFRDALSLFDQLREQRLSPDNFTYPFVFKSIGGLMDVPQGEKVQAFVFKCGMDFDSYVCNSIMDMYGELGCLESLKKVFDEMSERDSVSWSVLISGYVKCNRFDEAVKVFTLMRDNNFMKPNEAAIVSTLSACTALKKLDLGIEIHQYVEKEFQYTSKISNALLDMYSKCGSLSTAREIFDKITPKNVICWTSMVSGYVNSGYLNEARDLFNKSPVKDIVLWTAMINGYVQFNRVEEAMALFHDMQIQKIKPDHFTVVALLTGCAQLGALEQGKWIHEYINENKIAIDVVAGTALIDMYAKCGCIEKSMEIFNGLGEKDLGSWTSIICGLAVNGKSGKALEMFSDMIRIGLKPDDITFIGVLAACNHGGLVEKGREFFHSMKEVYNIEPKSEHYGCLIDLLGRAGLLHEAEDLIEKIPDKNNEIMVRHYVALLSACRNYSDVYMGERVAKRLAEITCRDSSVSTLVANAYACADKWDEVMRVRKQMEALKVKKTPGCSSIEV